MKIPDLTKSDYMGDKKRPVLLVGFISTDDKDYRTGEVDPAFLNRLEKYCERPFFTWRSYHVCAICEKSLSEYSRIYNYSNINVYAGNADIIVPSSRGVFYVSPIQLFHYVRDHRYLPPAEFIAAVKEMNDIDTSLYSE